MQHCLYTGSEYVKGIPTILEGGRFQINYTYHGENNCHSWTAFGASLYLGTFKSYECDPNRRMISKLVHSIPQFSRHNTGVTFALFSEVRHCLNMEEKLSRAIGYNFLKYGTCHDRDNDLPDLRYNYCGESGVLYEQFNSTDGTCSGRSINRQLLMGNYCYRPSSLLDYRGFVGPYCPSEKEDF